MTASRSLVMALTALTALSSCRIEKPATVVPAAPSIDSFTASATQVAKGDKVVLTWSTSNATSIELREASTGVLTAPVDTLQGSFDITVEAASLFVLVAKGPGGSDARAIAVTLNDPGVSDVVFEALPPEINGGESTTLAWTATGATSVSVKAGTQDINIGGQRASGAVSVSPRFDTTYTLTADSVTKTALVTVSPTILGASLSTGAAEVGDRVTVAWNVAGAERVIVSSPGRGQLFETTAQAQMLDGTFADTVPVIPDNGLVTYEVVAVKGATRLTRTLELGVGTGLAITRFTAPPVAGAGTNYRVSWDTVSCDQVEVKVDDATVYVTATRASALTGAFSFNAPTADFSVEIIATNTRGDRQAQRLQVDAVGIPTAATLTASPASVAVGQAVTLTFASTEARRVRITNTEGETVFSLTGQAAEAGTATVYPAASTTYTLSADNQLGNAAVTATASVTVTGSTPTLTQNPPTAISGQRVTLDPPNSSSLVYGFPHTLVQESSQADFIDISSTGTRVFEAADVATITLPFSTLMWGNRLSGPLTVSRAGWMAWGAAATVITSNSTSWPSSTGPAGMIAPFWDDLRLVANTSGIYAQLVGNAPDEVLIVQWDKMRVGTNAATEVTMQVQVSQRGMVSFQYKTMQLASAYTSFLVGLQDPAKAQFRTRAGTPASNSALYFFSPIAPPIEVQAIKGGSWSGYVQNGNVLSPVRLAANAVVIPTDLSITEIMHRPSPAVAQGQYFEVLNRTSAPLDLTGWSIRAASTPTFNVPANFVLPPAVPTVVGASADPAENDDAGVTLAWGSSGFFLSPDAGAFVVGTADAGATVTYVGPSDAGTGVSINVDPGPFITSSSTQLAQSCESTLAFGGQTPSQLGSPGALAGCGFGYRLVAIPSKFVELSDAGTRLGSGTLADEQTIVVDLDPGDGGLPAPVAFGERRSIVSMSTDGWMVFGANTSTASSNGTTVSTTSTTKGKLAIFWDDNEAPSGLTPPANMYWKYFPAGADANTPEEHWVFQWFRFSHSAVTPDDDLNFEVKLFANGVIEYHYGTMTHGGSTTNYANGSSASVWLERPEGTRALVISVNQANNIRPNTAYRFLPF